MFDFKFDWSKEMESGIENIDEQHKELFRIGRDLEQIIMVQCNNVTTQQVLDIICQLREYVSYHFYTEEDMMQRVNYPQYEQHKAEHDEYKASIININLPELGSDLPKHLPKVKEGIQDFLFQHIMTRDKELCKYLDACDEF